MEGGQIAELLVLIFCILLFLLYHVWYFFVKGTRKWPSGIEHINLWNTSLKTRSLWCELMMNDAKEILVAVQTIRNLIIAVSLLAAAEATLIGTLLNTLTDTARLQQIQEFSMTDPITNGNPLLSPAVKVALALAAVFLSFLTFAQCVRFSVHLDFLIRVVPAHPHINLPLRDETIILTNRASLFFTCGLRLLYGFVPLAFYMGLGPTALLISTVLVVVALLLLDTVPARQVKHLIRASTQATNDAASLAELGNTEQRPGPSSLSLKTFATAGPPEAAVAPLHESHRGRSEPASRRASVDSFIAWKLAV